MQTAGSRAALHRWRILAVVVVSAVVTVLAMLATSVPASAATSSESTVSDSVYVGAPQGNGGTGVYPVYTTPVSDPSNPGEPDFWAYCVENRVDAETDMTGQVGELDSFLGSNYFTNPVIQAKVAWILAHSYPTVSLGDFIANSGATGLTANDAVEATQYAIWRYTDLSYNPGVWQWATPTTEQPAYDYLIDGADKVTEPLPAAPAAPTISMTGPTGSQAAGSLVGPFTVNTNEPTATVSAPQGVTIVDKAGSPLTSNNVAAGTEFYLDLRDSSEAGSATVTATTEAADATYKIISVPTEPGGEPTAGAHAQSMILAAPTVQRATVSVNTQWVAAANATTTTAAATTTAETTTSTNATSTNPTSSQTSEKSSDAPTTSSSSKEATVSTDETSSTSQAVDGSADNSPLSSSTDVEVLGTSANEKALASTGFNPAILWAGLALLAAGGVLVLMARRRAAAHR